MIDPKRHDPPSTEVPGSPGTHGDVWQKIGWLDLLNRGIGIVRGALPGFSHSIQCAIAGGPNADIRRIWYLCASVVYGRFRNRVRTAGCAISAAATWDITEKVVSLELNYTANSLSSGFSTSSDAGFADPGNSGSALMARGPEQLTIGGGFNTVFNPLVTRLRDFPPAGPTIRPAWVAAITATGCVGAGGSGGPVAIYSTRTEGYDGTILFPGVGKEAIKVLRELPDGGLQTFPGAGGLRTTGLSAFAYPYRVSYIRFGLGFPGGTYVSPSTAALPRLPDEQRVITTNEKNDVRVQPPKPHLDGSTRSSFLALVSAALQTPCFLPAAPPCTQNGISGGLYVLPKGAPTSAEPEDLADLWGKRDSFDGKWPLDPTQGPDGYPTGAPNPQVVNYGG